MKPNRVTALGLIAFGVSLAVLSMLFLSDLVGAYQRAQQQPVDDPRPTAEAVPTPAQQAPGGTGETPGDENAAEDGAREAGATDNGAASGAGESARRGEVSSQWIGEQSKRTGVPARALQSYVAAEIWAARQFPRCGLRWNTLAGIGFVESGHGTLGGTALGADGRPVKAIIGPQLNGRGVARIIDTDTGSLDGDREFDRAVGPMQFLPTTWKAFGIDGNGDGHADAQSIDDAAASAAKYLCADNRSLASAEGWTQAILAYNPSDAYVRSVFDAANRAAQASVGAPLMPPAASRQPVPAPTGR